MMSLDNALEAWKELILNVDFAISMVEKDKREAVYLFLRHWQNHF